MARLRRQCSRALHLKIFATCFILLMSAVMGNFYTEYYGTRFIKTTRVASYPIKIPDIGNSVLQVPVAGSTHVIVGLEILHNLATSSKATHVYIWDCLTENSRLFILRI